MKIWFLAITTSLSIGFLGESLFSSSGSIDTPISEISESLDLEAATTMPDLATSTSMDTQPLAAQGIRLYDKKKYVQAKALFQTIIESATPIREKTIARRFLGQIYFNGYGVAQDYLRARRYFEAVLTTAGASGVALGHARRLLGMIYYFGNGVAQDYSRTRGYFEAVL